MIMKQIILLAKSMEMIYFGLWIFFLFWILFRIPPILQY